MFCEKSYSLLKDLQSTTNNLPSYNIELLAEITNDVSNNIRDNKNDLNSNGDTTLNNSVSTFIPTAIARHGAIERNVRAVLCYHYQRLKILRWIRWEFGGLIPDDIKRNCCPTELEWYSSYSTALAKYMISVVDTVGLNLTVDLNPPKHIFVEVMCLSNYGKYELSDGRVITLRKNSRHYLPRIECEELIRQGIIEHIVH